MSITDNLIELFNEATKGYDTKSHPESLRELAEDERLWTDVQLIEENFLSETRWMNVYEFIYYIPADDRYVRAIAELGATENQDQEVTTEVTEVFPHKEIVTKFSTEKVLNEDPMPYVYRIVDENGGFAKPVNKGYGAKPGESRWSTVKGLYAKEGYARSAIRNGAPGKYVERGEVIGWERL